jgi:hypothetical protein
MQYDAGIAQLVERNLAKVEVASSSLVSRSSFRSIALIGEVKKQRGVKQFNAGVAQLVERNLAKVEVASSSLVSRSIHQGKQRFPFCLEGRSF